MNQNTKLSYKKIFPENVVCKIPAILSQLHWVNAAYLLMQHSAITLKHPCGIPWSHSGFGLSQWETMLHSNVVSHWLSPYPGWFLPVSKWAHFKARALLWESSPMLLVKMVAPLETYRFVFGVLEWQVSYKKYDFKISNPLLLIMLRTSPQEMLWAVLPVHEIHFWDH